MAQLKTTVSTLRVKNAELSRDFFAQLGFRTIWERREAEGFPLFLEVNRDSVAFFLSEHNGDGPFGIYVYVLVDDAQALYDEFCRAGAQPGEPTRQPWGHLVFSLDDLDGNHLSFGSPADREP